MTHTELMALADAYAYQKALINVSQMLHSQILETDEARAALSDALKQVVQDAERYRYINELCSQVGRDAESIVRLIYSRQHLNALISDQHVAKQEKPE